MPHLELRVTDYEGDTAWRWELRDAAGAFLADHEVGLDRGETKARAFFDLPGYLRAYGDIQPVEELLAAAGAWIGEQVFGAVAAERFRVHPAVAEAGRHQAPAAVTARRRGAHFWSRCQ